MESGAKCPIRHPQSFVQNNRPMHFSSPQTYITSSSYRDCVAPASVGRPCTPPQVFSPPFSA